VMKKSDTSNSFFIVGTIFAVSCGLTAAISQWCGAVIFGLMAIGDYLFGAAMVVAEAIAAARNSGGK
jgi:hypothetical protein